MFDRYLVCEEDFRNVTSGGKVTGFQVKSLLSNWRGMPLSLIEDVGVKIDGESFPRDQIRVTVGGHTYALDEMRSLANVRWQFAERATITVIKPGGLAPGIHDVEISQRIRTGLAALPAGQAVVQPSSVGKRKMTLVV